MKIIERWIKYLKKEFKINIIIIRIKMNRRKYIIDKEMGDYYDKIILYKIPDLLILIPIHRIPMMIIIIIEIIEGIIIMIIGMEMMIGIDKDIKNLINP
jgi:hypothetical protein